MSTTIKKKTKKEKSKVMSEGQWEQTNQKDKTTGKDESEIAKQNSNKTETEENRETGGWRSLRMSGDQININKSQHN